MYRVKNTNNFRASRINIFMLIQNGETILDLPLPKGDTG
jgi:hypothetical protein